MGLTDLVKFNLPQIVSVDPELDLKITFQFHPDQGLEIEQTPNLTTNSTAGSEHPSTQWVSGGARLFRFSSAFVSKHILDDIRGDVDELESLIQRDANLGRGPRVSFTWGDKELTGYVERLPIRITGLWVTGLPKTVAFSVEIVGAPEVGAVADGGETQIIRFLSGETFESLGFRYLGNPLRGELIRRLNPKTAGFPEQAGDRVNVNERDHPTMQGAVRPLAAPFLDRDRTERTWQPVVQALGETRGSSQSRGLPWELLPEVQAGDVV